MNDDMNEFFKELIKQRLKETNYTVNQLSTECNISRDVLYRFLKGQTTSMGSEVLGKVFGFLGIKVGL